MKRCASALVVAVLLGCADRAEPEYAKCVQLEIAGDVAAAWVACNAAIAADPTSDSGKAAATKLTALKPQYEELQKREAEQRAKAEAEAREAEQRALQALRAKIRRQRTSDYEDDHCVGEGKPPLSVRFGGAAFRDMDAVAFADGCKAYDDSAIQVMGHAQGHYCCPR
jgi:hypothetical protein